ncbi:TLR adapter interacting with SLC15A4 on the lysosome [Bombina bombina]|uniref:TLR adapter interacting with SLC15A4 on the lysosome n=1 Tax=Bombina bombina TaxID=8345 RepID=UPI00235A865D|nr:TLR adapter interacting with SLC15A4 on the lysosome [Bombina bombina]
MLAEACLNRIAYKVITTNGEQKHHRNKITNETTDSCRPAVENTNGERLKRDTVLNSSSESSGLSEDERFVLYKQDLGMTAVQSSEAMYIPKKFQEKERQLDLYTSWSSMYGGIYKDYPDLHIGGDHILNKKDSGCILDIECESQDGPVLLSSDIAPGPAPIPQILVEPSTVSFLNVEENRERSTTLLNAPFSNSVLNGYMESKIQELYKQFLDEHIIRFGSQSTLFPSILMNNANQIGLQISQEINMESVKAKEAFLHYLRSVTSGDSSEFFTPVLHISNIESQKKA